MKEKRSLIVIGAGIAGLSTGVYAQMNGYQTLLLERHTLPGGLCTAWKRNGYVMDGCIHDLAGANPRSRLYHLWQELGALRDTPVVYHDVFTQIELSNGQTLTGYTDIDRFEAHLKQIAPEDARLIGEYAQAVRRLAQREAFALQDDFWRELPGWLTALPGVARWLPLNLGQFAARFKNPLLREALPKLQYNMPECPMLIHLAFMSSQTHQFVGWPRGGSLAFAQNIARRFKELGGELLYHAPVVKILVENNRAVGARLADGREFRADVVVSAADGHSTIYRLLGGAYVNKRIQRYYTLTPDQTMMGLQLSLGVAHPYSELPRALVVELAQPVKVGGQPLKSLDIEVFNYDPTLAGEGKSVIKVMAATSYAFWRNLMNQDTGRAAYEAEKQRVAEILIDSLEQRLPGLRQRVEAVDVATPLTLERFTGIYHGQQAWWPANPLSIVVNGISPTLPGLRNFYMVGQWATGMMGIHSVALSGRNLIRGLRRQDRQPFLAARAGLSEGCAA